VRTFAEQLKHIAADNYLLGAGILGEKPQGDVTDDERGSVLVHTKPQIIAYLKDSFTYMHRAAAAIDDAMSPIPTPDISPWPEGTATRLGIAIEDCLHSWDHYGQLVEYLRMNGIVPAGSRSAGNGSAAVQTSVNISQALDFWITKTEKEVVSAADAMPAEKYSFAPTAGEFAGVRTFGEQVKHLAANNYRMAARACWGRMQDPIKRLKLGPTMYVPRRRSWITSGARSQHCIRALQPRRRRTQCHRSWQRGSALPGRTRAFSLPWML
jgi:hypothetical protein